MKNLMKLSFLFLALTFVNNSFAQEIKKEVKTKTVEKPVKKATYTNAKKKPLTSPKERAVVKKDVMVKEKKTNFEKM
jgi:hypothetical protein